MGGLRGRHRVNDRRWEGRTGRSPTFLDPGSVCSLKLAFSCERIMHKCCPGVFVSVGPAPGRQPPSGGTSAELQARDSLPGALEREEAGDTQINPPPTAAHCPHCSPRTLRTARTVPASGWCPYSLSWAAPAVWVGAARTHPGPPALSSALSGKLTPGPAATPTLPSPPAKFFRDV